MSLFNTILRYRFMIVFLALASGLYAGWKSYSSPRSYTAQAQFMPKGAGGQSQLSGLAAQFGINVGAGGTHSTQFYLDLLESRPLLSPVADKIYTVRTDTGVVSGNLIRIFGINDPRPAVRRVRVINSLKAAVSATASPKTGVITFDVTSGRPDLSQQIAKNILDELNIYNLARRQEQAAAEREFVERRAEEALAQLRQAESDLGYFLDSNRQYRTSPQLTLEFGRLQRNMDMRQSIYTSLLQASETARIEEMRDLPVITVVEPPEVPLDPNRRGGARKAVTALLVGLIVGIALAFLRDRMAASRAAQSDDFVEFTALRREAVGDITHPWRPVARLFRPRTRA
ncbi:MAG: GNVR domain-containing protein [Gemmatimonadaceae bacterium]